MRLAKVALLLIIILAFPVWGCETEEEINCPEEVDLINETIANYKTAYLKGDLEKAREYLEKEYLEKEYGESDKITENVLEKEELKDEISPTAIPAAAVDTIKPVIVESYLEDIVSQVEIMEKDDEIAVVELELAYLDHEPFEQLFDDKLQEALEEAVVEKMEWENILADAMEEAPRNLYTIELELTKEDDSWKLSENPIPQEMYPRKFSDSISLAQNYVKSKENVAEKVEVLENSLREAGFENYLPLSDGENYEQFMEDLSNVKRDMELKDERNFSINTMNLLEIAGQIVELEEPILPGQIFDMDFDMDKEEVPILYEGKKIASAGDILKAWNYFFDEHIDEERRSGVEDFHGDEIRQGGRLEKHDSHDHLISFTLSWGPVRR